MKFSNKIKNQGKAILYESAITIIRILCWSLVVLFNHKVVIDIILSGISIAPWLVITFDIVIMLGAVFIEAVKFYKRAKNILHPPKRNRNNNKGSKNNNTPKSISNKKAVNKNIAL